MKNNLIFFIGPNKTGSNSIEKFLSNNNVKKVFHLGKNSIKEEYRKSKSLNYDIDFYLKFQDNFILNLIDQKIQEGFKCFLDLFDLFNIVPLLFEKYKDAIFIFNDRNINDWVDSRKKAISNNYINSRSWTLLEENDWRKNYILYKNFIQLNYPTVEFVNVCNNNDDFFKILEIINLPCINKEIPFLNKTNNKKCLYYSDFGDRNIFNPSLFKNNNWDKFSISDKNLNIYKNIKKDKVDNNILESKKK